MKLSEHCDFWEMSYPLIEISVLSALIGVASHLTYFKHGEHLIPAPRYIVALVVVPCLLPWGLRLAFDMDLWQASWTTGCIYWSFIVGLFTSMTIYRGFFHPLCAYPGPFGARFSQFWLVSKVVPKADQAWFIDRLVSTPLSFESYRGRSLDL
jgi:hypothetical protein